MFHNGTSLKASKWWAKNWTESGSARKACGNAIRKVGFWKGLWSSNWRYWLRHTVKSVEIREWRSRNGGPKAVLMDKYETRGILCSGLHNAWYYSKSGKHSLSCGGSSALPTLEQCISCRFTVGGSWTEKDLQYILLLVDDLCGCIWIHSCSSADSVGAIQALSNWISGFEIKGWVADQASHFTASVIKNLTNEARAPHHFTTPYYSWANCSVVPLFKEVMRTSRALLSGWKLFLNLEPIVGQCLHSFISQACLKNLRRERNEINHAA